MKPIRRGNKSIFDDKDGEVTYKNNEAREVFQEFTFQVASFPDNISPIG